MGCISPSFGCALYVAGHVYSGESDDRHRAVQPCSSEAALARPNFGLHQVYLTLNRNPQVLRPREYFGLPAPDNSHAGPTEVQLALAAPADARVVTTVRPGPTIEVRRGQRSVSPGQMRSPARTRSSPPSAEQSGRAAVQRAWSGRCRRGSGCCRVAGLDRGAFARCPDRRAEMTAGRRTPFSRGIRSCRIIRMISTAMGLWYPRPRHGHQPDGRDDRPCRHVI